MSVVLSKGGSMKLSAAADGVELRAVTVGLGWDPRSGFGDVFDLDASAVITGADGKALSDENYVFYNALVSPTGAVRHLGDDRDGAGGGDAESLVVDLSLLPFSAQSVVFIVSIDDAAARGQSFGLVDNAFIRVVNAADSRELARFDLTLGAASDTAMVFGELCFDEGDWKFRAMGKGYSDGLVSVFVEYGITTD